MSSLAGQLLIASMDLTNDFFAKAVVLVLEHSDADGATGIALNKPSDVLLNEIWPELAKEQFGRSDELMNIGGPCDGPVIALHSCNDYAETRLLPGVSMAVKSNNLLHLVARTDSNVRMFTGYSGWVPGQLENEIKEGAWYATEASSSLVFCDQAELWRRACKQFGNKIIAPVAGDQIPIDPSLN